MGEHPGQATSDIDIVSLYVMGSRADGKAVAARSRTTPLSSQRHRRLPTATNPRKKKRISIDRKTRS
jgi:hypothetical protein